MRFFTDIMHDPGTDYAEIKARFDAYSAHLETIRAQLPTNVYEFAAAPWHYDDGQEGLHDSWVESLVIEELSSGPRHEERSIEIRLRLLSAYHDRQVELRYKGVEAYKLQAPLGNPPSHRTWHGDWLYDEVDVSGAGLVVHEVRFSCGGSWYIECRDIEMISKPIAK